MDLRQHPNADNVNDTTFLFVCQIKNAMFLILTGLCIFCAKKSGMAGDRPPRWCYSRSGDRELRRRCGHTVGALCKRAGDCARFATAPTVCFRPRQKMGVRPRQNRSRVPDLDHRVFAIWRARTTGGGVFAQSKISQDRLILTMGYSRSGARELQRERRSHEGPSPAGIVNAIGY